jgi:hypothetical protein
MLNHYKIKKNKRTTVSRSKSSVNLGVILCFTKNLRSLKQHQAIQNQAKPRIKKNFYENHLQAPNRKKVHIISYSLKGS